MIDPSSGGSGVTENLPAALAGPRNVLDLENLVPGGLWRGVYRVREALPDITYGKMMAASHTATGENVILRSFRVTDESRSRTWSQLSGYKGPGLVPLIDAVELDGRRIEITRAHDGLNLAAWHGGKPTSEDQVRRIFSQIAEALIGLHDNSVAHLNLKPETILVEVIDGVPTVKITGLEAAADFSRAGLMSISVDPFYAPPEAIGLLQHHCGPALRAWDWWSVGRIIQELILGRHILGLMLDRDVTRRTPELLMRADRVLREKEATGPRAGGVEAMPEMSADLRTLLRGLLSSSRDARWGTSEVQRWLRGEPVKERYHVSVHERLFVWKDRAFPVSEAAEYFSESAHWSEALENIFGGEARGTLLAFLAEDSGTRDVFRRIQDLVKLPDSAAFADIDQAASRDVMTGIALATLSHGQVPMQVRGRRIDVAFLFECLGPNAPQDGLSLVQALTERTAIQHIGNIDVDTSRLLAEFERSAEAAVALAAQHHWISRADRKAWARLLAITLMPESEMRPLLEKLRQTYAVSRDEALDALFKKSELNASELAVLVFVGERPDHFKFVTHEKWTSERYQELRDKGEVLAAAITWVNLGKALRWGPHLVGSWPLVFAFWIVLGTPLALALPSRFTLGLVTFLALAACGARPFLRGIARRELMNRIPGATTLPTAGQCDVAASRAMRVPEAPSAKQLARELSTIETEIRALPTKSALASVNRPSRFFGLYVAALCSGVVLLGAFCGFGYQVAKHPPTIPMLLATWLHPTDQATLDAKKAADAKRAALAAEEDAANARKNRRKKDEGNEATISWSFRPSPNPQAVRVSKVQEPTPDQNREARETGAYLARPYKPETIDNLIALQVETENGVGLMLYDGKTGKVADKRLFVVSYVPLPRSWIMLGDHRAIFLNEN